MNRLRNILASCGVALGFAAGVARAETVVWSDNFDSGAASRWQAGGGWKIASPTAGPGLNGAGSRAYSGANCASTQAYPYNSDGRLACINYNGASSLVVPAANQFPRLRLWQWFSFKNALGYVEVSTNNGSSWNQLTQSYLNVNGGGVWSRPYFDLGAYAGQSIRIAFHFTSGGCCGNALGWFIDDVEVCTGAPSLGYKEGFEFDPKTSDWSEDAGTWEIGHPTTGPGAAHTGTNCAATVLSGNYSNNVDSRLITPMFIVPSASTPTLRFWHWYNLNNALGYVELNNGSISTVTITNVTATTNTVGTLNTNIYQLFGSAISDYDTALTWDKTSGSWTNATRAIELVNDYTEQGWFFEAGLRPLAPTNYGDLVIEYLATNSVSVIPIPGGSTGLTNAADLQGAGWDPVQFTGDSVIGYFGTNYTQTVTYTTNVISYQQNWIQLSPTYQNSASGWTPVSLDLSAYKGQTVRVAFHFTSGGSYTAPGWYVDDLSVAVPPELDVPTNTVVYAGDELAVSVSATNSYLPGATYKYTLVSPPSHMTITNGLITWQTSPNQPSSTNTVTVVATDNSSPAFTVTNSFLVMVYNQSIPTLILPPTQTIYAGQVMAVTVVATNQFAPDDTFTFAVVSTTATNLDDSDFPVDGVLTWPTVLNQRTGTYTNVIMVTDDVTGYSATNKFLVTVLSAPAPVLNLPGTQTIYAGQKLDVFVTATNSAFPDATYHYWVTNPPAGVAIDSASGELTWQTSPTNKTVTKSITVRAADNDRPSLGVSGLVSVTVSPTPRPTLMVPAVVTNYPGQQLAVALAATNVANPGAQYTFSLLAVSTNMFVTNSSFTAAVLTWTNTGIKNGVLTWTNNSVAPRTNTISVRVADNSAWGNSVTSSFALVFVAPPRPRLNLPTNIMLSVGATAVNPLSATNWAIPLATYTFAPAAAFTNGTIAGGTLTWTNSAAIPGVYTAMVKLIDNSVPPVSATNGFAVTVLPLPTQLNIGGAALVAGSKKFQLSIDTPWTNSAWRLEASTNLDAPEAAWRPIFTNKPGSSVTFTDPFTTNFPQRYYRAVFP